MREKKTSISSNQCVIHFTQFSRTRMSCVLLERFVNLLRYALFKWSKGMIRDIINLSKMSMLGLFYLFTEIYFLLVIKENFLNIPPL